MYCVRFCVFKQKAAYEMRISDWSSDVCSSYLPTFIDVEYDPGRKYSMPYTWLTLGIGYRKSKVKSPPDSWKVLFDSDEYKGRIAVLSEAGDMFRLDRKSVV